MPEQLAIILFLPFPRGAMRVSEAGVWKGDVPYMLVMRMGN